MKLSVIFPTRNEELLVASAIEDIERFLKNRKLSDYEILMVINGTNDNTRKIVSKSMIKNKRIRMISSNTGYGNAVKKGLGTAKGDYIAIFNVDFYDTRMLDLIFIDLYKKDLIIGSKMANWAKDNRPFARKFISHIFNSYLKLVFGFAGSDTHGIKIMKRSVVRALLPKCKTSSGIFDTEFVLRAQRLGYKIADLPVTVEEKRSPRFTKRLLQTPLDLLNLHRAFKMK